MYFSMHLSFQVLIKILNNMKSLHEATKPDMMKNVSTQFKKHLLEEICLGNIFKAEKFPNSGLQRSNFGVTLTR